MLRKTCLYPLPGRTCLGGLCWATVRRRGSHRSHRRQSSSAGITMMVAVVASAAVTTPPIEPAAAPPPADCIAAALTARPARLDKAIWLKTPPSPARAASGAAARLAGITEASVLIPGAASVQPCGTDMFPTRAALPTAPDTGAPPSAELKCAGSPPLAIGANAPLMNFGPAAKSAAPCPFWPQAYACPKDRNGPPGMAVSPCRENPPEAMVDVKLSQFTRSAWSPAGSDVKLVNCGTWSPANRFPVAVVGDCRMPFARLCSAVGSELMSWEISEMTELLATWLAAAA